MKLEFPAKRHVGYDESHNSVRILHAAKRVFIRDGWATFSARRVAKEAKVSLGALQHFFPSKHDLLSSMLDFTKSQFEAEYNKVIQKLPVNGRARLLGVIDVLIEDIWNLDSRTFFFNFWAMACHDEDAAALKAEIYREYVAGLAASIGAAEPAISEEHAQELAIQVAAMIEGLTLFAGSQDAYVASREQMCKMVRRSVMTLLSNPELHREQHLQSPAQRPTPSPRRPHRNTTTCS